MSSSDLMSVIFGALQSLSTLAAFIGLVMLTGWAIRYLPAEKLKRNGIIVFFAAAVIWLLSAFGMTWAISGSMMAM